MATKKEPVKQKDDTQKQIDNLAAQLRKVITSLERIFGVDIDRDGKVGRVKPVLLATLFAGVFVALFVVAQAAEDQVWRAFAQEGNDAVLTIEADQGDDAADELQLIMQADGDAVLSVGGTDVQTWNTTDNAGGAVTAAVSTTSAATTVGDINKTVITLTDHVITIDGSSGAGWGTTQLCTIVQGYIHVLGFKVDDIALTTNSTDLADGEGGDFSFGTTGTADNSLATTEVNLLASTSLDPIQTAVDAVQVVDIVPLDGTASGTPIYLNMLADDADVAATSTNLVNATVTLWWKYMGDN